MFLAGVFERIVALLLGGAFLARHGHDAHKPVGQGDGGLHRVADAGVRVGAADQAVNHDLHRVLEVLVQRDRLREVVETAVHAHAGVAAAPRVGKHLFVRALGIPHDGGEYHKARALRHREDAVDDGVHGLLLDFLTADRAVRHAAAGVQKTQVVVDRGGLLVDGDRGGKSLDRVDVGLVHLPEELPRVGGQRLDKAAVSLGVERVKRQRGFAAAREPGQHGQLVARDREVNVFQVVDPRAFDDDILCHGNTLSCEKVGKSGWRCGEGEA